MVTNAYESLTFVSVADDSQKPSVSSDPWDAPYFGAPIYLEYQPKSTAMTVIATTVTSAPQNPSAGQGDTSVAPGTFDPWDAPYFGGPVYLGYHSSALRQDTSKALAVTRASDTSDHDVRSAVTASADTALSLRMQHEFTGTKRRKWFSWIFGQRQ